MATRILLMVFLTHSLVGYSDDRRPIEQSGSVTIAVPLLERNSTELEKFMNCRPPFRPTARLEVLIEKQIILTKPLNHLDGVPNFAPRTELKFFGQTVLLVGAFDSTDWSEFYVHSPGTTAPPQTIVYVAGDENSVQAHVPPSERKWLFFQQDANFWSWVPSLQKSASAQSRVTAVTCFDDQARTRGTRK